MGPFIVKFFQEGIELGPLLQQIRARWPERSVTYVSGRSLSLKTESGRLQRKALPFLSCDLQSLIDLHE